jgi:hypothetical protein
MSTDGTSVAEREVVPSAAGGGLRAVAPFPLQGIAPGTYTLRATILTSGAPVGSVDATGDGMRSLGVAVATVVGAVAVSA